eukprot:Tbor_TRINITY_DN4686_c0_g1::TRINITY_DN4686_c0_g1_i1::g.15048::m.15048/K00797/speE, SRM; spermidine synthase
MFLQGILFRFFVFTLIITLVLCISAYMILGPYISIGNVTCFGLFGNTKVFVEMQHAKQIAYVYSESVLAHQERTPYQLIEVYRHPYFGSILVIDGALQITQRDEVNYHEMVVHVPMAYLPTATRALIIGGGDGGALNRLLQYSNIKHVDLVDIDLVAVRHVTQRYFQELYGGFLDTRTKQHEAEGHMWVTEQLKRGAINGAVDVIIVDSTDYGTAESLFTDDFYHKLKSLMSDKSIMTINLDSPSWSSLVVTNVQRQLSTIFKYVFVYQSHQPSFLSGHYSYAFVSDTVHPMKTIIDWTAWGDKNIYTYYYSPDVHFSSFFLPEESRRKFTMWARLSDVPVGGFYQGKQDMEEVIDVPMDTSRIPLVAPRSNNNRQLQAKRGDSCGEL